MKGETSNPNTTAEAIQSRPRRVVKPLVGLLAASAILVTACTLPPYFILRRRLVSIDGALNALYVARGTAAQYAPTAEVAQRMIRVGAQVEALRAQVDKIAGDVRDVRSIVLKERARLASVDARFDTLSGQLKAHEQRVLAGLAAEQKRNSKTDDEINVLQKTAEQNACNLSKVAVSLADIASFIDQTEIEQGVLPEQGKESSRHVNALRDSALRVLENMHKSN